MEAPHDWEKFVQGIIQQFGGICACCQVAETDLDQANPLTVHFIDGRCQNTHRENLIVLCGVCRENIQEEAKDYCDSSFEQPPLLEGYDYFTRMQMLRQKGLQQTHFKKLQEALKKAMLRLHRKKNQQLELFESHEGF